MRWMVTSIALSLVASGPATDLDELLPRLAENAALYRADALRFSCKETIEWVGWGDAGRRKFGYVFTYDDESGFQEYRTKYRETPKKRVRRVEPQEYGIPIHFNSAYLWCFTFRAERHKHHTYTIEGTGAVSGVDAVVIRFEPVPPLIRHVNDWYGKAWVDPETALLLKVEVVSPESHAALVALRTGAEIAGNTIKVLRITTWFNEHLEGRRVPNRVELRGERYILEQRINGSWRYRESIFLRVDHEYSDYRLFGVATKEKVGRHPNPDLD